MQVTIASARPLGNPFAAPPEAADHAGIRPTELGLLEVYKSNIAVMDPRPAGRPLIDHTNVRRSMDTGVGLSADLLTRADSRASTAPVRAPSPRATTPGRVSRYRRRRGR